MQRKTLWIAQPQDGSYAGEDRTRTPEAGAFALEFSEPNRSRAPTCDTVQTAACRWAKLLEFLQGATTQGIWKARSGLSPMVRATFRAETSENRRAP